MAKEPRGTKEGTQEASIEQWRINLGTGAAVYEGIKGFKGWKPGKEVTKEVYLDAVAAFCAASMGASGSEG